MLTCSILQAATYLGGSTGDGTSGALAIAANGTIYVTDSTPASSFPVTAGAYEENISGNDDIFIAHFTAGLDQMLAATYLGGSEDDYAKAIAIDSSGRIYVAGFTESNDFPGTTEGAQENSSGNDDMAIARLDADLSMLQAATYLGGSDSGDYAKAIAIDSTGRVYVAGYTDSDDFPVTTGGRRKTLVVTGTWP